MVSIKKIINKFSIPVELIPVMYEIDVLDKFMDGVLTVENDEYIIKNGDWSLSINKNTKEIYEIHKEEGFIPYVCGYIPDSSSQGYMKEIS
ncbi:hypothetical protein BGI41_05330 [Methanobrevibacter sp. 87.7]|uniref:hypothetical protein n=1 Tax=Methanobrevibacter sp. 87.7 TaxID=387957 RepID=UPI000B50290D|nr:hypothetical protein [Methanobrevibacter sp. 87.7]OWT32877.1 hypothetical protein BGI41_05330 [Methanobrevibacter sp. 87.7]